MNSDCAESDDESLAFAFHSLRFLSASQILFDSQSAALLRTKQTFPCSKFLSPGGGGGGWGQLCANTSSRVSQFHRIGVPKFYTKVNVLTVYCEG